MNIAVLFHFPYCPVGDLYFTFCIDVTRMIWYALWCNVTENQIDFNYFFTTKTVIGIHFEGEDYIMSVSYSLTFNTMFYKIY
jgi:hypothetical protein